MRARPLVAAFVGLVLAVVAIVAVGCQGNVFSLKVGECFSGAASGQVSDVNKVDCSVAHDSEVFSVVDYPSPPSDFPGSAAMEAAASARCPTDFQAYVGIDAATSSYGIGQLVPTAESWAQGDRQLVCLLHSATTGTTLTGSAKGTAK